MNRDEYISTFIPRSPSVRHWLHQQSTYRGCHCHGHGAMYT